MPVTATFAVCKWKNSGLLADRRPPGDLAILSETTFGFDCITQGNKNLDRRVAGRLRATIGLGLAESMECRP